MKPILLLDESLQVEIFYSCEDADLEDNICLKITESCPEEEKIFRHDESNMFLTCAQAQALANALLRAVEKSKKH
jgi:hypothetical protein